MRITRGRYPDPTTLDSEAGRQALQDLVAIATRLPGNQSYQTAADRATGQTVAMSVWDTEEHARSARDQMGDIVSRLQGLGMQLEPSEFFEVLTP